MRIGVIPENLLELLALRTGLVPTPVGDSFATLLLARSLMSATKLGVFEALRQGSRTADVIASDISCHPGATAKLLDALVSCRYLEREHDRYRLSPMARKWLLADSSSSLRDYILFRYLEWDLLTHVDDYVRTGVALDIHRQMTDAEHWRTYQRGMRSLSALSAREIAARTPMPEAPKAMLDIGGSHGFNSVCFCRRHPQLKATVLDLPEAVAHAEPILAEERMGDRVVHRSGDVLETDLGIAVYDFVFMGQLVHHFDAATNRELAHRIARALKPQGVLAVVEVERPDGSHTEGQLGAFLNFYFAMTSRSGTWSRDDIANWQREAGLHPLAPIRLRRMPGGIIQAARKH